MPLESPTSQSEGLSTQAMVIVRAAASRGKESLHTKQRTDRCTLKVRFEGLEIRSEGSGAPGDRAPPSLRT